MITAEQLIKTVGRDMAREMVDTGWKYLRSVHQPYLVAFTRREMQHWGNLESAGIAVLELERVLKETA